MHYIDNMVVITHGGDIEHSGTRTVGTMCAYAFEQPANRDITGAWVASIRDRRGFMHSVYMANAHLREYDPETDAEKR